MPEVSDEVETEGVERRRPRFNGRSISRAVSGDISGFSGIMSSVSYLELVFGNFQGYLSVSPKLYMALDDTGCMISIML